MVWFWVIAQICMGLCIEGPNVNKLNGVYVGLLFFTVLGLKTCLENILSEKGKRIFISGTVAVYVIFAVSFIHYYFTQYTQETHPLYLFCDTYEDILENWKDVIGDKTCIFRFFLYILCSWKRNIADGVTTGRKRKQKP